MRDGAVSEQPWPYGSGFRESFAQPIVAPA